MDEFLEDEVKLGHGFTSADALEEVDIGDGDRNATCRYVGRCCCRT